MIRHSTLFFMQTRYHIKSISVNSFKSFGNNTTIQFTEQLTCIVGKNGCGKSALIDAICCCLGVDVKRLRCSKYSELITHLETTTADKCTIQLEFQDILNSRSGIRISFSSDMNGTTVYDRIRLVPRIVIDIMGNLYLVNVYVKQSQINLVYELLLILYL